MCRGFGENVRFALLAVRAHKLRDVPDRARHRRGRGDGHRDGLHRDRLQQQHGQQLPELRGDARAVPEVRAAVRAGRAAAGRRTAAQGPDARRRGGASRPGSPRCARSRPRATSGTTRDYHLHYRDDGSPVAARLRRPGGVPDRDEPPRRRGTVPDLDGGGPRRERDRARRRDPREAFPALRPAEQAHPARARQLHRHRGVREEGEDVRGVAGQPRRDSPDDLRSPFPLDQGPAAATATPSASRRSPTDPIRSR